MIMGQIFSCTRCNKNKRDNAPLDFDIGVELKQEKGIENASYDESDIDSNLNVSKEKLDATSAVNGDNDKAIPNSKVAQAVENNDRIAGTETSVVQGKEIVSEDNKSKLSKSEEIQSDKEYNSSDDNKGIVEEGINNQSKSSHITLAKDSAGQNIDHANVSSKEVEVAYNQKKEENQTIDEKHSPSHIQENNKTPSVEDKIDASDESMDINEYKAVSNEAVGPNALGSLLINDEGKKNQSPEKASEICKNIGKSTVEFNDSNTKNVSSSTENIKIDYTEVIDENISTKILKEESDISSEANQQQSGNNDKSVKEDVGAMESEEKVATELSLDSKLKLELKSTKISDDSVYFQIDKNIIVQTVNTVVKEDRDIDVSCDSKKDIETVSPSKEVNGSIQIRNKPEEEAIDDSLFPPVTSRNSIVTASTYGISEVVSAARVAKRLKARRSLSKEEYKESILI